MKLFLTGWLRNRTGSRNRRNRFFPKPKAEPEPPEPFSRNRNRNRNRPFLLNSTETQKNPFCRGTARTENRNRLNRLFPKPYPNRTEPGPPCFKLPERGLTFFGHVSDRFSWAMFRKSQPLLVSKKVRQYISNLYGSTPPICIAVLSWLLSFQERETCNTLPVCTAVRLPFVRQYAPHLYGSTFWKNAGGWGHRNVSDFALFSNHFSQSPDLPLAHGLAPPETMI